LKEEIDSAETMERIAKIKTLQDASKRMPFYFDIMAIGNSAMDETLKKIVLQKVLKSAVFWIPLQHDPLLISLNLQFGYHNWKLIIKDPRLISLMITSKLSQMAFLQYIETRMHFIELALNAEKMEVE